MKASPYSLRSLNVSYRQQASRQDLLFTFHISTFPDSSQHPPPCPRIFLCFVSTKMYRLKKLVQYNDVKITFASMRFSRASGPDQFRFGSFFGRIRIWTKRKGFCSESVPPVIDFNENKFVAQFSDEQQCIFSKDCLIYRKELGEFFFV